MSNPSPNNIIDLELPIEKKKFRFGKDDSRVVAINTSDLNFISRMSEAYPKLHDLQMRAANISEGIKFDDQDNLDSMMSDLGTMGERLKAIDAEMRELIDFMFQAPVSSAAAPDGSMYDPFDGSFRFELIMTVLIEQFGGRYKDEFKRMDEKVKKHAGKYVGR